MVHSPMALRRAWPRLPCLLFVVAPLLAGATLDCDFSAFTSDARCAWWQSTLLPPPVGTECVYLNASSTGPSVVEVAACGTMTALFVSAQSPVSRITLAPACEGVTALVTEDMTTAATMSVHFLTLTRVDNTVQLCGHLPAGATATVMFTNGLGIVGLHGRFDEGSTVAVASDVKEITVGASSSVFGTVTFAPSNNVEMLNAGAVDYLSGTWIGLTGYLGQLLQPRVAWRGANITLGKRFGNFGLWAFVLDNSSLAIGGEGHPRRCRVDAANHSAVVINRAGGRYRDALIVAADRTTDVEITGGASNTDLELTVLPSATDGSFCAFHGSGVAFGSVTITGPPITARGSPSEGVGGNFSHPPSSLTSSLLFERCTVTRETWRYDTAVSVTGNMSGVNVTFVEMTFGRGSGSRVLPSTIDGVSDGTFVFHRCAFNFEVGGFSLTRTMMFALLVRDVVTTTVDITEGAISSRPLGPFSEEKTEFNDIFPVAISNATATRVLVEAAVSHLGNPERHLFGAVVVEESDGSDVTITLAVADDSNVDDKATPVLLQRLTGPLGTAISVTMTSCRRTSIRSVQFGHDVTSFRRLQVHHGDGCRCPFSSDLPPTPIVVTLPPGVFGGPDFFPGAARKEEAIERRALHALSDTSAPVAVAGDLKLSGRFAALSMANISNVRWLSIDGAVVTGDVSLRSFTNTTRLTISDTTAENVVLSALVNVPTISVDGIVATSCVIESVESTHTITVSNTVVEGSEESAVRIDGASDVSAVTVSNVTVALSGRAHDETRGIYVGTVRHQASPASVVVRGCRVTAVHALPGITALIYVRTVTGPRTAQTQSRVHIEGNTLTAATPPVAGTGSYAGVVVGALWSAVDSSVDPPLGLVLAPENERAALRITNNSIAILANGTAAPRSSGIVVRGANVSSALLSANEIDVRWVGQDHPGSAITATGLLPLGVDVEVVGNTLRVGAAAPPPPGSPSPSFVDFGAAACAESSVFSSKNVMSPANASSVIYYAVPLLAATCRMTFVEDTFEAPGMMTPPPIIKTTGAVPPGAVRMKQTTIAHGDPLVTRPVAPSDVPAGAVLVSADHCNFQDTCGAHAVSLARCLPNNEEGQAAREGGFLCVCRCQDGSVSNNTVPSLQCTEDEPSSMRSYCRVVSPSASLTPSRSTSVTAVGSLSLTVAVTISGELRPTASVARSRSRSLSITAVAPATSTVAPSKSVSSAVSLSRSATVSIASATSTLIRSRSVSAAITATAVVTSTGPVPVTASLPFTHTATAVVSASSSASQRPIPTSSRSTTVDASRTITGAHSVTAFVSASASTSVSANASVSTTPSMSLTLNQMVVILSGASALPGFYLHHRTAGLLFALRRGTGVAAQRPLRFSVASATTQPVAVVQLGVARTMPARSAGAVSVNGAVFETASDDSSPGGRCGQLQQADVIQGTTSVSTTSADAALSIAAGPTFEQSCDSSLSFGGVVTYAAGAVLRRAVVSRPATLVGGLTMGNVSGQAPLQQSSTARFQAQGSSTLPAVVNVFGAATTEPTLGTFPGERSSTPSGPFEAVHCGAADLDAFEATPRHIGLGPALSCVTPTGDACRTAAEYHQRCASDPNCAGFTAAVTSSTGATLQSTEARDALFAEVPVMMHAVPALPRQGVAVSREATDAELANLREQLPGRPVVVETAFYKRVPTEQRSCRVRVANSGRVRVMLQQTSLADASVDVFVTVRSSGLELRRGRCGGPNLFASSQPGQSGACDLFLECTDVFVNAGDVVTVVPQPGVHQFGCNESLGALLLFEAGSGAATGSGPAFAGHDVAGFVRRSIGARPAVVDNKAIARLTFPVLTFAAHNATLRVAQTRFGCRVGQGGPGDENLPQCPTSGVVSMTTSVLDSQADNSRVTCGGIDGFPALGGSPKGYTGQCQVSLDCSESLLAPMPSSSDPSVVGLWAQRTVVSVDPALLRASPQAAGAGGYTCSAFTADLFVDPAQSSLTAPASTPPLFPLWCRSSGPEGGSAFDRGQRLCPVLVSPAATARATVAGGAAALRDHTLRSVITAGHLARSRPPLVSVLALAELRDTKNRDSVALLVDWWAIQRSATTAGASEAVQKDDLARALRPDATYACLMDTAPTTGAVTCTVPIPHNTTTAAVDVLQTDFAANGLQLTFLTADGSVVEEATSCGAADLFMGQRGRASQCDTFLPCRRGFIPIPSSGQKSASMNRPVAIKITVPEHLANGPCDWALAAMVTFGSTPRPAPCDSASEFTCGSDASCIPQTAVCDGVPNDCGDNSDEAQCRFTLVDRGFAPNASIVAASLPVVTTHTACLRETVLTGGRGFFIDAVSGCRVINRTNAVLLIAEPSRWTAPQPGYRRRGELHIATPLVTPLSEYRRCSAVLHCADRGVVIDHTTCACRCLTSYTGPHCETLVRSGAVVTYVAVVGRGIAQTTNASKIPLNTLSAALAPPALFPAVRITSVRQPVSFDDDHVAFPFTADSEDRPALAVFFSQIFSAAALQAMNDVLRPATGLRSTVAFIFGIDAPNDLRFVGSCRATTDGNVTHCPTAPFSHGSLLLTGAGLSQVRVTAGSEEVAVSSVSSRRVEYHEATSTGVANTTAGAGAVVLHCVGASVSYGDVTTGTRCRPRTCLLAVGHSAPLNVTSALAISGGSVDPGCPAPALTVSAAPGVEQPPLVVPDSAAVSQSAEEGFAAATIAAGCVVLLLIAGVSVATAVFGVSLRNAATAIAERATVRREAWLLARESHGRVCGRESMIVAAVAIVVMVGLCGGFFAVLYVHSRTWGSDAAVVVELYQTAQCGGQRLKTLPLSMTVLEATGRCEALSVTGHSVGSLFGAAECVDTGVGKSPRLRISRTLEGCRSSSRLVSVTPHTCVDFEAVLPGTSSRFAEASCVSSEAAEARRHSLARYNPVEPMLEQVTVSHDNAASPSPGALFTAPFLSGYTKALSTSHTAGTVAAIAGPEHYTGGYEATRLVVQDDDALCDAGRLPYVSPTERALQANLTHLDLTGAGLGALTPKDDDYPVGFVFSGFGSSAEIAGDAAGLGAQRYRGVRATDFDIGHHFAPDPSKARLTVTVSFWLRATTASQGFVFAVTDDYEDTHDRLSPIMKRLLKVAASGESGTVPWFTQDWHAYSSLYIDGAAQSLAFVFADPREELAALRSDGFAGAAQGARDQHVPVIRAQWELASMGAGSVFNGAWHKVSVALRNDEGRFFAVIAIDGRSSLSDPRWRKCLSRRPRPILKSIGSQSGRVNVTRQSRAAVSNGGVMYVGHFNGAVRGLAVGRSFDGGAGDVRSGTRAMRVHAAMPYRAGVEAVGVLLLLSAAVTFMYVLLSAAAIVKHKHAADAERSVEAEKTFDSDCASSKVFTAEYVPLPFARCVAWLGVTPRAMMQIHEELAASPTTLDGKVKIIMALWSARHAQLNAEAGQEGRMKKYFGFVAAAGASVLGSSSSTATSSSEEPSDTADWADSPTPAEYPTAEEWRCFLERQGVREVSVSDGEASGAEVPEAATGSADKKAANAAAFSTNGADDTKAAPQSNVRIGEDGGGGAGPNASGGAAQNDAGESARQGSANAAGSDLGLGGEQLSAVVFSAFGTLQVAAVYVGAFAVVPAAYDEHFGGLFGFLTLGLEFFQAWASDPLAGAMAQAVAVVIVLVAVACVLANDDRRFYGTVLRYRIRRDTLALAGDENADVAQLTAKAQRMLAAVDPEFDPTGTRRPFAELHAVHLLSPEQRCAVSDCLRSDDADATIGVTARDGHAQVVKAGEKACWGAPAALTFPEKLSQPTPCDGGGEDGAVSEVGLSDVDITTGNSGGGGASTEAAEKEVLRTTGHACIHHQTWLSCEEYTDVYPYYNRRRCCAVTDGDPCGRRVGPMHCCTNAECGYALCADHIRFAGPVGLMMQLRAVASRFTRNGPVWVVEFVILSLALALYTPALRTCVMIVGCHPVYQCEFGDCWSYPTQRFAAAAYLAIVVLVLYGALFPLAFIVLLYSRFRALRRLFARPSYGGRYLRAVPSDDTPALNAEAQKLSFAVTVGFLVSAAAKSFAKSAHLLRHSISLGKPIDGDQTESSDASTPAADLDSPPSTLADSRDRFVDRWIIPTHSSGTAASPLSTEPLGTADGDVVFSPPEPSELWSSVSSPKSLRLRLSQFYVAPKASRISTKSMNSQLQCQSRSNPPTQSPSAVCVSDTTPAAATSSSAVEVHSDMASEHLDAVDPQEWQRFLVADQSVMARLYASVPMERMGAVPVLSAARFLLLVPPLLLEPSSASQFLFIALGEAAFAVGFVLAEPYTSPWVTVTTLAGSVHQFVVVAVQALATAKANDEDYRRIAGAVMTSATVVYIAFVAVVVGAVLLHSVVAAKLHQALSAGFFARFGLPRPATEPVFLCPTNDLGQGPVETVSLEQRDASVSAVVDGVVHTTAETAAETAKASAVPSVTAVGSASSDRCGRGGPDAAVGRRKRSVVVIDDECGTDDAPRVFPLAPVGGPVDAALDLSVVPSAAESAFGSSCGSDVRQASVQRSASMERGARESQTRPGMRVTRSISTERRWRRRASSTPCIVPCTDGYESPAFNQ